MTGLRFQPQMARDMSSCTAWANGTPSTPPRQKGKFPGLGGWDSGAAQNPPLDPMWRAGQEAVAFRETTQLGGRGQELL